MDTGSASNVYLGISPFLIQDQVTTGEAVLQALQQDRNDCAAPVINKHLLWMLRTCKIFWDFSCAQRTVNFYFLLSTNIHN